VHIVNIIHITNCTGCKRLYFL